MAGYSETMLRGLQGIAGQAMQQRRLAQQQQQQEHSRRLQEAQLQRQYEVMQQTAQQRETANELAGQRLQTQINAQNQPRFGEVKSVLTPSGDAIPAAINQKTGRLHDMRTGQPMSLGDQDTLQKQESLSSKELEGLRGNADELTQAVQAYGLMRGKTVGGVKGDPTATGWEGWLPNIARQVPGIYRATGGKSGAMTRAAIANLGSLKVKERSGTQVSGAEFARLSPYLPNEYDDESTAREKLSTFIREYRSLLTNKLEMLQKSGRPVPKALQSYVKGRIASSVAGTKNEQFLSPEEITALDLIYKGGGNGRP